MATAAAFRSSFACLWCGAAHETRGHDDLEGWAQLCPICLGRAGENPFLRFRLHAAIADRAAAGRDGRPPGIAAAAAPPVPAGPAPAAAPIAAALAPPAAEAASTAGEAPSTAAEAASTAGEAPSTAAEAAPTAAALASHAAEATPTAAAEDDEMVAYYEARAPEYDDWYLRRGRYEHGPIDDMAWQADLDAATTWLDGLPLGGRIVELAAGTGWWSPLLATKGELWCYDAASAPLDRARDRLLAHRLRAHLHVRDAWADPEQVADALFTGFWLSHVPRARLVEFLGLAARWLRPGGIYAFIDSRFDRQSSAVDHAPSPEAETSVRRLSDGRTFTIPKIYYEPAELEAALLAAGFGEATVTMTPRFFVLGTARR